ncbi:unnamed protein product [Prorocentrum cordatum]|uniref:Uncharacterized protein n=1 Tax=Prorocentrum cordatum TaxID=2364126 RepID=A0ABN9Q503_9DINO|nr:unnamed protein product [Polarella glacialis]
MLNRTSMKMAVLLSTYVLAVLVWLFFYHFMVRPRSKTRGCSIPEQDSEGCCGGPRETADLTAQEKNVKGQTVQEIKMHSVYSWLNTNPAYVLKCKYFFTDADGKDI